MMDDPHIWRRQATGKGVDCILVGDINLQERLAPASAFRHLRGTLSGAGVLFGNLEGCLYSAGENDIPSKRLWRHSDPSMVQALTSVGFDAVGCANNVTFGAEATLSSLRVLDRAGIAHCGAGADRRAARKPAVVEKGGVRFGFLQYTARLQAAEQAADAGRPGVAAFDPDNPAELAEICSDVRALRSEVDVLVVSHHIRRTGWAEAEDYQRSLAEGCIDAGADAVFGHGAHVNQGIALWRGAPIFHCVGQIVFDGAAARNHRDGLLVRLLIEDRRIACASVLTVYRDGENNPYLTDPRLEAEGRRQLEALRELSPGVRLEAEHGEVVVLSASARPAAAAGRRGAIPSSL